MPDTSDQMRVTNENLSDHKNIEFNWRQVNNQAQIETTRNTKSMRGWNTKSVRIDTL